MQTGQTLFGDMKMAHLQNGRIKSDYMKKVLIATRTFGKYSNKPVAYLTDNGFEVVHLKNPSEFPMLLKNADAVIVGTHKITEKMIEHSKKLKIIAKHGVGIDNIDIEAATKKGIPVVIAKDSNSNSVAELVIGFIFALSRNLISAHNSFYYDHEENNWVGFEVNGKTIGVIGFGSIGKMTVEKALSLGMKVLVYDPYVIFNYNKKVEKMFVVNLVELLEKSDFVSIHVPLTGNTYNLINEEELRVMKKTAFLINTARGGIVNETALAKALNKGWIAGAALDVFETEPLPPSSPLFKCKNIIITPHVASHTFEATNKMGIMAAKSVVDFFGGKIPSSIVNPEAIKYMNFD